MKIITCMWIDKKLNIDAINYIKSWLEQDYSVVIFTYALPLSFSIINKICRNKNISIIDANIILPYDDALKLRMTHPISEIYFIINLIINLNIKFVSLVIIDLMVLKKQHLIY